MRRVRHMLLWALLLTAATQCVTYTEGIEVDVAYEAPPMVAAIQTDLGYRVRLEQAMITFGELELVFCDGAMEHVLRRFAASRARAHSETGPRKLGVPVIFDLMESAGVPVLAGTLKPPPGRYCAVRIASSPSDEDAEGSEFQRKAMLNLTVLLLGSVERSDGARIGPLGIRLTERMERELPFAQPLVLDGPELSIPLSVQIDTRRWFEGIDFGSESESTVRAQVTENIRASLEASLGDFGEMK